VPRELAQQASWLGMLDLYERLNAGRALIGRQAE
jgi:hypothetical protein